MNSREASLLRTRLRQVNIEYSALVRDRAGEGRFVRMGELKAERAELMALLAGDGMSALGAGLRIIPDRSIDTATRHAT